MSFRNEYILNVDVKRRMTSIVPTFKQGDSATLKFKIFDDGKEFDLTDFTRSEITFRLPSGQTIVGEPFLDASTKMIVYHFVGVEMSEVGKLETILSIYSGTSMVSIQPFSVWIFDHLKDKDLSYIGILQDLIAEVELLKTDVKNTLEEANQIKDDLDELLVETEASETIRNTNELERIANENTRKSNETDRKTSEDTRKSNEATRIQNEQTRNANEQIRQQSLSEMNTIINQYKFTGTYKTNVTYKKFNQVEFEGSSYIALVDNTNVPVSDTNTWRIFAQKGLKGDKGDTGAALSILGKLTDASQLPPTGQAGDAYTVNGELYVWSEVTGEWENVGNIKGEKGDTGDSGEDGKSAYEVAIENGFVGTSEEWLASLKGAKGDPGKDADLTEINQKVDGLNNEVTEHLAEYTQLEARVTTLEEGGSANLESINGLYREVAYMKLKQDAKERIDGGTVFADDFKGNSFGFTFNEAESNNVTMVNGKIRLADYEGINYKVEPVTVSATRDTIGSSTTSNKAVITENGWIVAILRGFATNQLGVFINKNDGQGFKRSCYFDGSSNAYYTDFDIVSVGNKITIATHHVDVAYAVTLDVTNIVDGTNYANKLIRVSGSNESGMSGVSICYDTTSKDYTVVWSAKLPSFDQAWNLSYVKSSDGTVWTTNKRITRSASSSTTFLYPSVSSKDGKMAVVCERAYGHNAIVCIGEGIASNYLGSYVEDASKFGSTLVYGTSSQETARTPKIITHQDGITRVFFKAMAVGDNVLKVRMVTSIDGYNSWSNSSIVYNSAIFSYSCTVDKSGKPHVSIIDNSGVVTLHQLDKNTATWTNNVLPSGAMAYTSLVDLARFNGGMTPPVVVISNTSSFFVGEWDDMIIQQNTEGVVVYDIPSTTFVGAYVEKIGNVTVTATLNNIPMKSELDGNEYEFSKSLVSEAPAQLKLNLSRPDVSNGENDALTRILGGRA